MHTLKEFAVLPWNDLLGLAFSAAYCFLSWYVIVSLYPLHRALRRLEKEEHKPLHD
jgi:hypothetical protein